MKLVPENSTMLANLHTVVINLDSSADRMAATAARLNQLGLPFERFPAVDVRGVSLDSIGKYDRLQAMRTQNRELLPGEVGCYLSHMGCLKRFLESGKKHLLVLEDDCDLPDDFVSIIAGIVELDSTGNLPDWDIVNLARSPRKFMRKLATIRGKANTVELVRAYYFPIVTTGLLWSQLGAQRYLDEWRSITGPVDQVFRDIYSANGRGLAVVPNLVGARDVVSDIIQNKNYRYINPRTKGYYFFKHKKQLALYAKIIPNFLLKRR
ncbi:MAG: glycosyltransferase family 25 protein [Paracoccaceae bacterium]